MVHLSATSIGGISAALLAATVSLIGLIISKEQKTSEFRQAWIEALRVYLSSYLTQVNAISDATRVNYKDHGEKVATLAPLYSLMNTAVFNINLRVNPDEKPTQDVLAALNKMQMLCTNDQRLTSQNIRPVEEELLLASKYLLKSEWKRVKSGEATFQLAKIIALIVFIAAGGAITIGLTQSDPAVVSKVDHPPSGQGTTQPDKGK